jgi:uncharacterized membrane protein
MKRILILMSLVALPVLIGALVATSILDVLPFYFDYFGIVLGISGISYLCGSIYLRNKQRKLAMNLMLIGEIYLVTGIILFTWFHESFYQ